MRFLEAPRLQTEAYDSGSSLYSKRGIPLGTSISLIVANLVTYRVAEELDKLGVKFAFYSDDSIIWSDRYDKIAQAANVISSISVDMGLTINHAKSDGITLLTPLGSKREMAGKDTVSFIGHKIDTQSISMSDSLVCEAKRRISQLIFFNLLQEPLNGTLNAERLEPIDRDYSVLLSQIRRYLYGNLREEQVRNYLSRAAPKIHYRGFMSFFPVIDDDDSLRKLDGWLATKIYITLRRRAARLNDLGASALPEPHGRKRTELVNLKVGSVDLSIPGFLRMNKLLRSAALTYGVNAVANPKSAYYYP